MGLTVPLHLRTAKYRPTGRNPAVGIDCLGFALALLNTASIGRIWQGDRALLRHLNTKSTETDNPQSRDLLCCWHRGHLCHVAVFTDQAHVAHMTKAGFRHDTLERFDPFTAFDNLTFHRINT